VGSNLAKTCVILRVRQSVNLIKQSNNQGAERLSFVTRGSTPRKMLESLKNNRTDRIQETCAERVSKYRHNVPLLKRGHTIPTDTVPTAFLTRIASIGKMNMATFVLEQLTYLTYRISA